MKESNEGPRRTAVVPRMTPPDALASIDAQRQALATVERVDGAKAIRDKAKGIQSYERAARNTSMFEKATRLLMDAERRAGELLNAMAKSGERKTRQTAARKKGNQRSVAPLIFDGVPPTLHELGITEMPIKEVARAR